MENQLSDRKLKELRSMEHKIRECLATGRLAIREIGAGLAWIQREELWRQGSDKADFYHYAYDAFGLERHNVIYAVGASRTFWLLERAKLKPPLNDTQAAALSSLDDEQQLSVWKRVVEECENAEVDITVARVKDAVKQERNGHQEEDGGKGVEVDMGEFDEDQINLTQRGEEAVARIKALCGAQIEKAIRQRRNPKLTEDAVIKWSDQDDETVKAIPEYVIDKGWGVRKALNYLSQLLEGDTALDELVLMARNRGGHFSGKFEDARITVDILKI